MTDLVTVRVTLEVTVRQLDKLTQVASQHGWMREEPRKRWTVSEQKEAARYAVEALVREVLV